MKKILAAVLSVVLCLFMALPAFADEAETGKTEIEYPGQDASQDVKVTISGEVVHVYLVDIEFTNPVFAYSTGSKWDPTDYTYKPNAGGEWSGIGSVKIINHSDLPVNYTVEKKDVVTTYGSLDIEVANGTGTIGKCTPDTNRGDMNATATYSVTGTPTVSEITAQRLGSIKVTIAKVNAEG